MLSPNTAAFPGVQNQQYQLDIYRSPCHSRCKGLILLETFTTLADEELIASLPPFLRYFFTSLRTFTLLPFPQELPPFLRYFFPSLGLLFFPQ